MTNKELVLYINNEAEGIPKIPVKWLKNKLKFIIPKKKTNQSRSVIVAHVLHVHNNIPFIIEVRYSYNWNFTEWVILNQRVFSAYINGKIVKSAYYIMSYGYRANEEISFQVDRSTYTWYLTEFDLVYKANNFQRSLKTIDNFDTPIYETLYKIGLKHLYGYAQEKINKPYSSLGLNEYMDKSKFKEFVEWVKQFKKFNLNLYIDFLKMAKNKKVKDIFVPNWLELHDKWSGITKQRENEKKVKKQIIEWNNVDYNADDIKIISMKTKDDVIKLGTELNNCLKNGNYKPSEIFEIYNYKVGGSLALHFKGKSIKQLYAFKNKEVNNKVHTLIKKLMIQKQIEQKLGKEK